jgi:hypothetical protein
MESANLQRRRVIRESGRLGGDRPTGRGHLRRRREVGGRGPVAPCAASPRHSGGEGRLERENGAVPSRV